MDNLFVSKHEAIPVDDFIREMKVKSVSNFMSFLTKVCSKYEVVYFEIY